MKRFLLIFSIFFLVTTLVQGQNKNRQRIKLLKMSYITDALELSESEAEKFWPVYNQFTNKIQRLRREQDGGLVKEVARLNGLDNITEEQAQSLVEKSMQLESEISTAKRNMNKALAKIISARKILKLHKAEKDFNREILREYGKRRGMPRQ